MHAQQQQLINGAWLAGDAASLSKHDPVSGQRLWEAATASEDQVATAVKAARSAFPGWARTPFAERQALVEPGRHATHEAVSGTMDEDVSYLVRRRASRQPTAA